MTVMELSIFNPTTRSGTTVLRQHWNTHCHAASLKLEGHSARMATPSTVVAMSWYRQCTADEPLPSPEAPALPSSPPPRLSSSPLATKRSASATSTSAAATVASSGSGALSHCVHSWAKRRYTSCCARSCRSVGSDATMSRVAYSTCNSCRVPCQEPRSEDSTEFELRVEMAPDNTWYCPANVPLSWLDCRRCSKCDATTRPSQGDVDSGASRYTMAFDRTSSYLMPTQASQGEGEERGVHAACRHSHALVHTKVEH